MVRAVVPLTASMIRSRAEQEAARHAAERARLEHAGREPVDWEYDIRTRTYRVRFANGTVQTFAEADPVLEGLRPRFRASYGYTRSRSQASFTTTAPPKPKPNAKLLAILDEIIAEHPERTPEPTPNVPLRLAITATVWVGCAVLGAWLSTQSTFTTGGTF